MKRKRQYPTKRSLGVKLTQVQNNVRQLAMLVDPPFKPEDYAAASTIADSVIQQLAEADVKDNGRRSVLVPILLYDALLAASYGALGTVATAKAEPTTSNPFAGPMGEEGGM